MEVPRPLRFDGDRPRRVTSPPMRFHAHRRFIAGTALLAFLFAVMFPTLAVARQAFDPLAYAKICRIDAGTAGESAGGAGSLQDKLKKAHCVMCVGAASPLPAISLAPAVVVIVPELLLPVDRRPLVISEPFVLQPLNPRAPPRA